MQYNSLVAKNVVCCARCGKCKEDPFGTPQDVIFGIRRKSSTAYSLSSGDQSQHSRGDRVQDDCYVHSSSPFESPFRDSDDAMLYFEFFV
jgi:hypothetical protein